MANPTALPPTGAQHELAAGEYTATVTELGAGLRQLSHQGTPVIFGYDVTQLPPAGAGQLLVPWPNRVDGGRYAFRGHSYQLDLSEPSRGNAIHGLTRWAGWALGDRTPGSVALRHRLLGQPGYPFRLELTVEYELDAKSGLRVSVTAHNAGPAPAPYGTGQHPYLTAGPATVDDCELQLAAAQWLPTDDRGIPAGPPQDVTGTNHDFRSGRPLAGVSADHALTGLARDSGGRARALLRAADGREVELWAGPGYDWLQVFTGDPLPPERRRRALAVEPMTCPPNALASGSGLLVLEPGDAVTHSWGLAVRPT